MSCIISPSLLSANFLDLRKDIEMINNSEAQWLHMDIMDGSFVPNISFGFPILEAVGKFCTKQMDVHFMIENPEKYISMTAKTSAAIMTVHIEACKHLHRTVQQIHSAGMKAGVAINPATPICLLEDILADIDLVLIMSVNPGFGGQKFITNSLKKIAKLKKMIQETESNALIEVDGGVNKETAPLLVKAGTDVLVSGSYIFKSENPVNTISELRNL